MRKISKCKGDHCDDCELELLILRKLARSLQAHKLYHLLLMSLGSYNINNNPCSIFWSLQPRHKMHINHSFLADCETYTQAAWRLKVMDSPIPRPDNKSQVKEIQEYVMFRLNDLLHILVEPCKPNAIEGVEKIGQETFSSICTELFGVGFVDYTAQAPPKINNEFLQSLSREIREEITKAINNYTPTTINAPIWFGENDERGEWCNLFSDDGSF